jgi:hypothetical protein
VPISVQEDEDRRENRRESDPRLVEDGKMAGERGGGGGEEEEEDRRDFVTRGMRCSSILMTTLYDPLALSLLPLAMKD